MLRSIPYTIIPFVIFNLVIIFGEATIWDNEIFSIPLFSGVEWPLRIGDLMVLVGLFALMGEVFRATSIAKNAVTNHLLSIIVLIAFVIEFVVVADAANSTFFILTIIALIDVLTGVVVTLRLATRDVSFGEHLPPPN